MTVQTRDRIHYDEEEFTLIGVDGEGLFDPADYGVKVIPISTACWRGFYCVYSIIDNALYLRETYLGLDKETERLIQAGKGIKLFGKVPHRYNYRGINIKDKNKWKYRKSKKFDSWDFRCEDLQELIKFTGAILIGSPIKNARGIYYPENFDNFVELIFDRGQLIEVSNLNQKISELRNLYATGELKQSGTRSQIKAREEWLRNCFLGDYLL